jgi:hypothetical protein
MSDITLQEIAKLSELAGLSTQFRRGLNFKPKSCMFPLADNHKPGGEFADVDKKLKHLTLSTLSELLIECMDSKS